MDKHGAREKNVFYERLAVSRVARDLHLFRAMINFLSQLKLSLRVLRKTPAFSLAALIVLALGIGANTTIFSIVHGVLLRPLPFPEPERLVQLWHTPPQKSFPGMTRFSLSAANYLDWAQQNSVFESSAIYSFTSFRMTGSGDPQMVRAASVEPTFFSTWGVRPQLGRGFVPGDDQGERQYQAVLSNRLWMTQFGGDAGIVGRTIDLNGRHYTVVGVMPPSFQNPDSALLWTPHVWTPAERAVRDEHHFLAVARLKRDVSVQQAQAQLDTIAERLAQQYPAANAGWGARVVPMREETSGEVRRPLLVLLGAVAFVLLIACANVANLMLARTLDRRKEFAIRTAIGASRPRLMWQTMTEAVLLAVAGGALGLIVAHFGTAIVVNFLGSSLPRLGEITLDSTVLAFTFTIAVLTGIAAGFAPAWKFANANPHDALKQGGRSGSAAAGKHTRNALVLVEVALSLVLLVGAGLMIRTLWNLRGSDPGFEAARVLTMTVGVSDGDYRTEAEEVAFFDEALRRVRAVPGVAAAGAIDNLPLEGGSNQPIAIEGQPTLALADQPEVSVRVVTPAYFGAMRIAMLQGRDFSEHDTAQAAKVVVVSESLAKRFWPNQDAVGKRMTLTFFPDAVREVVGVVRDVKINGLDVADPVPTVYWPMSQIYMPARFGHFRAFPMKLAVRAVENPEQVIADVRTALHQLSPHTPVVDLQTMNQLLTQSIAPQRFNMLLLATFAGLAVLLAGVGIYSVLAYTVRQRMREIGIRMALGAKITDVLRLVVFEGMQPTLLGVAIGIIASLQLGGALGGLIYGVRPTDVATFVSVSVLLVAVAFAASIVPAYRATRVDPLQTLRDE